MPTNADHHSMSRSLQARCQGRADQSAGAGHQDAKAAWLRRMAWSGSVASLASTCMLSWLSHRRTGAASAATNATSHWLWGARAQRRNGASVRHAAVGYLIHHMSSWFWAAAYEAATGRESDRIERAAAAAGTAALAYAVDYGLVPRRLTPGFEARLPRRDLLWVYAAFAAGLALAHAAKPARQRGSPR